MTDLSQEFNDSWSAFNARQQAGRDAWLAQKIAALDCFYQRLGQWGRVFKESFTKTGCSESVDLHLSARASLQAHHVVRGFINKIHYSPAVLNDVKEIFSSRTHEGIHALQFSISAAAHATPFNSKSKIILCPRDAILLEELKERDAFAKQALFDELLEQKAPETDQAALEGVLRDHAATVLEKMKWNDEQSFLDYYRFKEIQEYEDRMVSRLAAEPEITFVRLDPEDILSIGSALGLKTFGDADQDALAWAAHRPLSPAQQARLDSLNRKLGIADEALLPGLGQALQASGTTRAGFLAHSLGNSPNSAVGAPPAPCL